MTASEPLCVSIEDSDAPGASIEKPPLILRRSSEQALDAVYVSEARQLRSRMQAVTPSLDFITPRQIPKLRDLPPHCLRLLSICTAAPQAVLRAA